MVGKIGRIVMNATMSAHRLGCATTASLIRSAVMQREAKPSITQPRAARFLSFGVGPNKLSARTFVSGEAFGGNLDTWPRPHRWRRPLLSHIKRFARNCSRLLSASTQRPAAVGSRTDEPDEGDGSIPRSNGLPSRLHSTTKSKASLETDSRPEGSVQAAAGCLVKTTTRTRTW